MAVSRSNSLKVAKYALMPQVFPRLTELFFSGFSFFGYFIALVFSGTRLLPKGHPYLNPQNIGLFSIIDVIAAAGRALKYRRENIDQIVIFYAILLGIFLMGLQVLTMAFSIFMPSAMALSMSYYFGQDITSSPPLSFGPSQDIAFILLDRVFGVPGIYDSCVSTGVSCFRATHTLTNSAETIYTPSTFPWPFHNALHVLYEFYSIGLLIVAMFIVLYFVVVIVAETAQTGVPFGKRFNSVWAPVRLVIAIGLLVPIGYGLNTAQYIVLYAAKFGSNFATNGWMVFNSNLTTGHLIEGVVAKPQKPEVADLLRFMMLAHACKALEEGYMVYASKPPATSGTDCDSAMGAAEQQNTRINGYLVKKGDATSNSAILEGTNYADAMTFFDNSSFTIRFGDRGCTVDHNTELGNVVPTCGELTLAPAAYDDAGALAIQEGYYGLIQHLWGEYSGQYWDHWGFCDDTKIDTVLGSSGNTDFKLRSLYYVQKYCPREYTSGASPKLTASHQLDPDSNWINTIMSGYTNGDVCSDPGYPSNVPVPSGTSILASAIVENIVRAGVQAAASDITGASAADYQIPIDQLARGWAGAGMWYNHIASINGAVSGAAWSTPQVSKWPLIQSNLMTQKKMNDQGTTVGAATSPTNSGKTSIQTERGTQEVQAGGALYRLDIAWSGATLPLKPKAGNFIFNALNWLFGTQGLFDLKDPVNQSTHPLALMTALGKGLVEASIRNLGLAVGGQVAQIFADEITGPMIGGFSSLLYSAATMTLTAGFILYYVLPFLPFVYFFFAVGNWVKGIFEALVGVPLWALAHIRIDGDGLPGSAALNGYFLIFEIFLRPILIIFGLIASVSIFAAMAIVFNSIFDLAVYNVGGVNLSAAMCGTTPDPSLMANARGPVDQFFYTIMYAVVIYIMGLSSFKLIDLIPNKILRWMGASVDTFADMAGDPASQITNYAAIGGSQMTSSLIGSMRQGVSAVGSGVKAAVPKSDD